jgi:putative tryptophan/tyrosine transport system substrate-binding protein
MGRPALALAVLVLLAVVPAVLAQPAGHVPRVGVLLTTAAGQNLSDLRQGLRELGYVEPETIAIEVVSAEGTLDRLPTLARELVRRPVDLIVTSGPPAIAAARAATTAIPIVMGRMDDVDAHGFVTNLAHPGGNITGLSFQTGELAGKWIDLLRDAVPRLSRVAVLWDTTGTARQRTTAEDAARALGLHVDLLRVRGSAGLDQAFARAGALRSEGLVILASPALTAEHARLAEMAARHRLPAIYYNRAFAEAGGLLSYGPTAVDFSWRRAAAFVDKILKGAKPGDLPIQQPTTFELVVNRATARALGLTLAPSLLLRADHVVE